MSRRWLAGMAVLLPITLAAQEVRQFGAASFVPPSGWSLESQPRMQVFSRVQGPARCMLVLSAETPAPSGPAAAFASTWRTLFGSGFRSAELPASAERTSATGSPYLVGEGPLEDAAGNRLVARLHVFPLGSSTQAVVLIGNGAAALAGCQQDWEAFFRSLRFGATAAASGQPNAPVEVPAEGPQQFENLRFVAPPGWRVYRLRGAVHLSRTGVRDPERLEVFLLSGHVAPNLEAEVGTGWEELRTLLGAVELRNVSGRTYDLDGPSTSLAGVEYLTGNGGMRMGGVEWDVTIYAFRAGERIERAAVFARAFSENLVRYTTANNPRYSREIRELLFRMAFVNHPARSTPPARLGPGGIAGVWAGLGMSFGGIKPQLAVFFDNGQAYFGPTLPLEGLDEIDPLVEQPTHRRDWGSYTWTGDGGVLTMPYGAIPLRSVGADLELTTNRSPHRYIKLAMPQSSYLDGTWCGSGAACLRLMADGRFEDRGAVRAVEHELYAWPQTPAGGRGRYILRAHTLRLSYDGGPELRIAFPGLEDGRTSSPNRLWLGWNLDLLARQQ